MFRNWQIRTKIVVIAITIMVMVAGGLFWLNSHESKTVAVHQFVSQARSVVMTTESVREEMAHKWDIGIFDQHLMSEWASAGEIEKVLGAVPVVTAWTAAMAKAEEGGYEFRVPKVHPRNPDNEPDALEARILKRFRDDSQLTEHYEIDEELNAIRYFRPIRLTQECMLCHGDPATSVTLWGNDQGLDPTGARMENWNVGDVHGAFEVIQSLDEADARIMASLVKSLAVLSFGIVGGGALLFFLVTQSVSNPIREAVARFKMFAAGDLTQRLTVRSKDEVGQLGIATNGLIDTLRGMIRDMDTSATTLGQSSTVLSQTANELTGGAEHVTTQSSSVASAAEEMSVNMTNMAASSEQMKMNVATVASAVEEMTASIQEIASSADQAASVAGDAAQLVDVSNTNVGQLGDAANEIGNVIETIQDIAEQTNLLALNATIEAARAGDAGKGFAVVATEVKELAKQTAVATEDIRERIEGIQSSTGKAVDSIAEISKVIQHVNEVSTTIASAVEEQSITTREIAQNITQTSDAAQTVSIGVAESASAAHEITENIANVDRAARETVQGASQTQAAGDELSSLSEELQSLVGKFKI